MARNTRLPELTNTPTSGSGSQTINHSGGPSEFSISYSRTKKGKDSFADYTVSPSEEWASMKLYKKFISKSH
jgi:hypothetical protein